MNNLKSNTDNQFIDKLHQAHLKRVNFYHAPKAELTRFSWSGNKHVIIYVVKVFSDYRRYDHSTMYFAVKADTAKDDIKFMDLISRTNNPEFSRIGDSLVLSRVAWLISQGLIDKNISEKICQASTDFTFSDFDEKKNDDIFFEEWAKTWVDREYDAAQEAEENSTPVQKFPNFPNTKQRFFIDRYHFKDMLESLDDSQFTDEFNQCLFAYENEKWFLCAIGLGSCLEHLMLIILTNYEKNGFRDEKNRGIFYGFPKNPTARDYVRLFTKDPINITSRQATFINLLYMARNSVDHHNTGKTQKNLCDLLLDGISDMYNDYYSSSVLYKPAPKEDE
jgi:hypothetical protein